MNHCFSGMAASFTHPLTGERKITFPEHIRHAESRVLCLVFVVYLWNVIPDMICD